MRVVVSSWSTNPAKGGDVLDWLDEHVCGLFPRATWLRLIGEAAFEVRPVPLVHDERPVGAEGFLAIRPG